MSVANQATGATGPMNSDHNRHADLVQEILDAVCNLPKLGAASHKYAVEGLEELGYSADQMNEDHPSYVESVQTLYYGRVAEFQMAMTGRAIGYMSNPK